MVVLFDVPASTSEERRYYARFRKELLGLGYLQLQESVYIKHMQNLRNLETEKRKISAVSPPRGRVIAFTMTVAQFESIAVLAGECEILENFCSPVLCF